MLVEPMSQAAHDALAGDRRPAPAQVEADAMERGQADDEQRRQKPAESDVEPEIHAQPATGGQAVLGLMKIDQRDE